MGGDAGQQEAAVLGHGLAGAPARYPWFDDWAAPEGDALHDLTSDVAARLDRDEEERGLRQRQRRARVETERELAIGVICANLAHLVLDASLPARRAVLLGKTPFPPKRYRSPASGRLRTALLDQMAGLGLLDLQTSRVWREASNFGPTAAFRDLCRARSVTLQDIGRLPKEETIVAKLRRDPKRPTPPKLLDYPETLETGEMRDLVARLNLQLAQADIRFIDDGEGPVNAYDRHMRRLFNGDPSNPLEGNGRLFGGFWQNLKSRRRGSIRVDGEELVVVDYSSMFARLAYARMGVQPPEGDLYAVPGLEGHREAVKKLVSAFLFDRSNRRPSWPDSPGMTPPAGISVAQARAAILAHHPMLKQCFGCCLGHSLMRQESDIIVTVLRRLMEENVVGLNLYDGVLAPASTADFVKQTMTQVSLEMTGMMIPATVKSTTPTPQANPAPR